MVNLQRSLLTSSLVLGYASEAFAAFVHPGLLVTTSDLDRAKAKIEAKLDPWLASWDKLTGSEYAQAEYTNNAVEVIYRGSDGEHHRRGVGVTGSLDEGGGGRWARPGSGRVAADRRAGSGATGGLAACS